MNERHGRTYYQKKTCTVEEGWSNKRRLARRLVAGARLVECALRLRGARTQPTGTACIGQEHRGDAASSSSKPRPLVRRLRPRPCAVRCVRPGRVRRFCKRGVGTVYYAFREEHVPGVVVSTAEDVVTNGARAAAPREQDAAGVRRPRRESEAGFFFASWRASSSPPRKDREPPRSSTFKAY